MSKNEKDVICIGKFASWLDGVISSTAWEMTPPKAYGPFHLGLTAVGLLLCVLVAYKLRHVGEKGNKVVLIGTGAFLMLTELYKQLFYFFFMEEQTYNFGIFPFHLCSVPMYLCIIAPLLKPGKLQRGMYHFMTTFNLLGGIMAFIEPSGITHSYWTLTLHAYIWHMTLIFIGVYLLMSGRYAKTMKDFWSACVTFVALCALAFIINVSLWDVSGGDINMFFVGPRNSSLIVFKQISEAAGWYVSTLLYIPTVCIGAYIVFLPAHLWAKRKEKKAAAAGAAT